MHPHLVRVGAAGPASAYAGALTMQPSLLPALQNQLIECLPAAPRERLLAQCDCVVLPLLGELCTPGQASEYAYFPVSGVVSMALFADNHPGLEVGMVGREGMLGLPLALGVASGTLRATVQGAGTAWRIAAAAMQREVAHSSALRGVLNRYVLVRMAELATGAACQRFHPIGPRLARRLLMSQDRAGTHRFHVTQESLANMLGVRRVGVTTAASALQRSGVIEYHRGELTVLSRPQLEAAACSCYARDRHSYAELMA